MQSIGGSNKETVTADRVDLTPGALSTHLHLRSGLDRIQIGQNPSSCFVGSYAKPTRATPINELPPGFDEGFDAAGWESISRTVSVVSKDFAIVLAIDIQSELKPEQAKEIEDDYTLRFSGSSTSIKTEKTTYHFWQDRSVRLMMCQYTMPNGKIVLTTALGLNHLMDALRMEPDLAQQDADAAATVFSRNTQPPATNNPADASE
ncbi:hypothetical protein QPK87_07250 [Kamptonema cortianum]|nr:hypothetical protein [Geitlerinema splendidum]MDK3156371.1 hypothetical protein [Kamptonema cortianum]